MKKKIAFIMTAVIMIFNMLPMPFARAATINIGDYIQMGSYYGKPIKWRCVDIDENGPLMLSDRILCLKAFDASGSNINLQQQQDPYKPYGSHQRGYNSGYYRKRDGSNYWADSNIRCWLNSRAGAGNVSWTCGNPPNKSHMWSGYNAYENEAGFLTNFTNSELAAIKTVTQKSLLDRYEYSDMSQYGSGYHNYNSSIGNVVQNYDTAYSERVKDSMFLLDVKQINRVYQNDSKLGGNNYYIGIPTPEAVANSEYKSSSLTATARCWSWLRSPNAYNVSEDVRGVGSDGCVYGFNACNGGGGVRPAFYLNLSSCSFKAGAGTFERPYSVYGSGKITAGQSDSSVSSDSSPAYSTDEEKILASMGVDLQHMLAGVEVKNDTIKGPQITILGKTFYLYEMDGKLDIKLSEKFNLQFKMDKDKKKLSALIGFKPINSSANIGQGYNDEEDAYWKKSYEQTKDLFKAISNYNADTNELWNKFSSLRGQLKEFDADLLVKAKGSVAGFAEWSYETGKLEFSEGGAVLSASIGGEFVGQVPPPFSICYCTVGLQASFDGKFSFKYSDMLYVTMKVTPAIAANVGVGIGYKKTKLKTYIEGGVIGTLNADLVVSSDPAVSASADWLTLKLKGDVYIKAALLDGWISGEKKWNIGELQLYPRNDVSLMSMSTADEEETTREILENATLMPRDYLNVFTLSAFSVTEDNTIYADRAVYDDCRPSLVKLADGSVMMIYLDDDGTKSDINKTTLFYTVCTDGVWSAPQKVYEDGAYNGPCVVFQSNGKTGILWEKANEVLPDDTGLEEMIEKTDLYYTEYENGAFTEPLRVTDNKLTELGYSICSSGDETAAVWVENSQNDVYMQEGTNIVKKKILSDGVWSEEETILSTENNISEICAEYINGVLYTAVVVGDETDGYVINLSDGNTINGNNIDFYDNKMFFLDNGALYSYSLDTNKASQIDANNVSNFKIYDGDIYTVVMTDDKMASELYVSKLENGTYQPFTQVTAFGKYIRDFSISESADGEKLYALNIVNEGADDKVFGIAELVVCTEDIINDTALSAIYHDYEAIKPNAVLPITADIENTGNQPTQKVTVKIKDESGAVVYESTVDKTIEPGTTGSVTVEYTLPSKIALTELTVEAFAFNDEKDTSDNSKKLIYGLGDAEISDLSVERTDGGAVIKGTVSNDGYTRLSNVSVYITDAADTQTRLDSVSCGNIAAGDDYDFEIAVPEQYMTLEDKMTMYGIKAFVETASEEASYGNNDEKVVFGNLAERTVTLCDGDKIIDIISYKDFNSYRYRKPGYHLKGWDNGEGVLYRTIDSEPDEDLVLVADFEECADDFSIYSAQVRRVENGTRAVLDLDYTNRDFDVYLGIYDGEKLISADKQHVSEGDTVAELSTGLKLDEKYYTAKLFIWDDFMAPLSDVTTQNVYLNQNVTVDTVLETAHDYPSNCDESYSYSYDGLCESISVTFSDETETEADADYINIYDKSDVLVGSYSGTSLAGKTITVPGDTVKIRLVSDATLQAYGFRTEKIVVNR